MRLTYSHFHLPKYSHYSKPIKGLKGCVVDYRFSFNGQEKDDEVAGVGSINTAEFWEYDTRLGRRWNLDPKGVFFPTISQYSTFLNNPIKFNDPYGDIAPAIWAIIVYAMETGAETGVDIALGTAIQYLSGVPYGTWDILIDYGTNLVPAWGEIKKVKKVEQITEAIYKIGSKIHKVPGGDELIKKVGKGLEEFKNSGNLDGIKDLWGSLLEMRVLAKYENLAGISVKSKQLLNENILNLPKNLLTKLQKNLARTDFEFDGIAKLASGGFEFIEIASKKGFQEAKDFSSLNSSDMNYLIGKFDKWKRVQNSGVNSEFRFVIEGASQEFLDSVSKKAKELYGISVKAVSQ
jgi:hypothetical protein